MSDADKILAEMLEAVPNTYQKTVGFPTWDWLAAASIPIAQTEAELEEARRQLDPANLTGEALEAYIFPRTGQRRTAATCAVGNLTATGNGTIPAGALFESGGGVQFEATETVVIAGAGTVSIRCVTPGAAGDLPAESITMMPVQIAGIVSVTNEEPTAEGYEAETDAAYYQRFLLRVQTPPTSGNQYHYLEWAMEVSGVGGVQVYPLDQGANTVGVVLVDQFGEPASEELVEQVQTHIDPDSKGIGEGEAPIGAYCYVSAAVEQAVALSLADLPAGVPDPGAGGGGGTGDRGGRDPGGGVRVPERAGAGGVPAVPLPGEGVPGELCPHRLRHPGHGRGGGLRGADRQRRDGESDRPGQARRGAGGGVCLLC